MPESALRSNFISTKSTSYLRAAGGQGGEASTCEQTKRIVGMRPLGAAADVAEPTTWRERVCAPLGAHAEFPSQKTPSAVA